MKKIFLIIVSVLLYVSVLGQVNNPSGIISSGGNAGASSSQDNSEQGILKVGNNFLLGHAASGTGLTDFTSNRYLYTDAFDLETRGTSGYTYFDGSLGTFSVNTTTPTSPFEVKNLAGTNYFVINPTAGNLSVYIGENAGQAANGINTIGNVAVGHNALQSNLTDGDQTAIGVNTLQQHTTGTQNTAIGADVMTSMIIGANNTAVGDAAMNQANNTNNNTVVGGGGSMLSASGAINNSIVGYNNAEFITGQNNSLLGYEAGRDLVDANNNTLLGYIVGHQITSGKRNLIAGYGANSVLTTGNDNILIGGNLNVDAGGTSNFLSIGNAIFGTGVDGTNVTTSTGNIGIHQRAPQAKLHSTGSLRLDGLTTTPAVGMVLMATSVNGDADWQFASGGATAAEGIRINGTVIELGSPSQNIGGTAFSSDRFINLDNFALELESSIGDAEPTARFQSDGDVLFGTDAVVINTDALFFDKSKGSLYGGRSSTAGDFTGLGNRSFTWGVNNTVTGAQSVAFGNSATVLGVTAGVGSGQSNTASSTSSYVGGGNNNTASGIESYVGGGDSNIASGLESYIGGGNTNSTSKTWGTIGGGTNNVQNSTNGAAPTISGGNANSIGGASAAYSSIGGGTTNVITNSSEATIAGGANSSITNADNASIMGGSTNLITGTNGVDNFSSIVGGSFNDIIATGNSRNNTINGGINNTISGTNRNVGSIIGGGEANVISDISGAAFSASAVLSGGNNNTITGDQSYLTFIGGGSSNIITSSNQSSIVGGLTNSITGIAGQVAQLSFVGGGSTNIINETIPSNFDNGGNSFTGRISILGGQNNAANATYSTILGGLNNVTNAALSLSSGYATETNSLNQIALGSQNVAKVGQNPSQWVWEDDLVTLGNGIGSTPLKSNAFTILKKGWTQIQTKTQQMAVPASLSDAKVTPLAAFHLDTVNDTDNEADSGALIAPMTSVQRGTIPAGNLQDGLEIYCTDCVATDLTIGVKQVYQLSTASWRNLW